MDASDAGGVASGYNFGFQFFSVPVKTTHWQRGAMSSARGGKVRRMERPGGGRGRKTQGDVTPLLEANILKERDFARVQQGDVTPVLEAIRF